MNRKKVIAALASVAALASLAACGGVKDGGAATGNTITVGTTDKITSLDPAGSYDNGSYAVQIQVFPFLYAQNYNTSELSPDIAADDGTWSADGTEFTVKLKKGLKFANGHDLTASDVKFSFDRIKKINDENGPSSLLANIESVETKDDTTVVFHSAVKDDVTLKQVLSSPAARSSTRVLLRRQADRCQHHRQGQRLRRPVQAHLLQGERGPGICQERFLQGSDPS